MARLKLSMLWIALGAAILSILPASEAFSLAAAPNRQFRFTPRASPASLLSTSSPFHETRATTLTHFKLFSSTQTIENNDSHEEVGGIPLPNHSGKVAIVIGASRGIGKGIAVECALSGMTVYVVGRSTRRDKEGYKSMLKRDLGEEWNEDSTIERTCEDIEALIGGHDGGKAIPVPCDISDRSQVTSLIDKVKSEQGRCDLLVYSAYPAPPIDAQWRDEFWKQNVEMWDPLCEVGLRAAYMSCCEAIPLMIDTAIDNNSKSKPNNRPLIALVSSFGGRSYVFNVAYGVQKAAIDRLASDMSVQLKQYNIDTVSLYPGLVRTEGNMQLLRAGTWDEASGGNMDLENCSESPRFSGRAIVHLMDRSNGSMEWIGGSGKVGVVAELAKFVGFVDEDGRRPPSIRSLRYLLPSFVFPKIEKEANASIPNFIKNNIPDFLLPWDVFTSGPPPED